VARPSLSRMASTIGCPRGPERTRALLEEIAAGRRGVQLRAQVLAAKRGATREQVEEAFQEACLKAARRCRGQTMGQVYTWLRMATDSNVDDMRDRLKREVLVDHSAAEFQAVDASLAPPDEVLIKREERAELDELTVAILDRLAERERKIAMLHCHGLAKKWLDEYRVAIKALADERQAVYDDIIAMSSEPQRIDILRPRVRAEESKTADGNLVDTRPAHLMSDPNGEFPIGSLNDWEEQVLDSERAQGGFLAWYRNPSRASNDSLAIAYKDGKGNWRRMCPDFIFFHGDESDVKVSLVDPHGFHLADALPKLRGLATFTEAFGEEFHRIEAVAKMKDGTLRVLDATADAVRDAIRAADDAEQLYLSSAATDY
jgi:hypothetical protein